MRDLDYEFGFSISLHTLKGAERRKAIINLRWMLTAFVGCIAEGYEVGAPRREQACSMVEKYAQKLKPKLDENEWYQFRKGMLDEDTERCYFRHDHNLM